MNGYFYPRPPRGGRPIINGQFYGFEVFLSTPSARRATGMAFPPFCRSGISIHALREEGDLEALRVILGVEISIHALREEGDKAVHAASVTLAISIHALREEGDCQSMPASHRPSDFYPRPPRGGRLAAAVNSRLMSIFLSTPSARRATCGYHRRHRRPRDFYPRPPRGGRQQKQRQNLYFQTNYTTFCTNLEEP